MAVAGHEPPDFEFPQDSRFKFLTLDHPLPSLEHGYYLAAVRDKLIKLAAAWNYAKATWNPEYVMKLDWDDLVSSRLVDWLVSAEDEAGYLIKYGWVWRSSRHFIQRTEHFDRVCGSCLIIRSDLADRPGPFLTEVEGAVLDEAGSRFAASDQHLLVPGSGTTTLLLNDSHQRYASQFEYLGHRLATVPFSVGICRIDHGNNAGDPSPHTQTVRMFLGRIRRMRLITPSLKKEFMLVDRANRKPPGTWDQSQSTSLECGSAIKMDNSPIVAFLIPFASRQIKSNWEVACAHLRQTLKSIQNSSNGNYRVVVAGHEPPDFNVQFDSRFYFLSLQHSIPSRENNLVSATLDKLTKIAAAWDYAKSTWNPKYVIKLDADDFISSRLVDWLENAGGEGGYLVKDGWFWRSGSRYLIERTEYLDRKCASCLIIRSDLADKNGPFLTEVEGVPLDEAGSRFAASDHYSLVPGSGTSTLLLNDSHQRYGAQFAYLGYKLSTVPFNAIVYRTGNPDSNSSVVQVGRPKYTPRMLLGSIRRTRFITQKLRKEFMLD